MGKHDPTNFASKEASERKSPDILQHGETSTLCKRVLEGEINREKHKGRHQLPEGQRQDFLNKMESLQNLPWLEENSPWWDAKAFLASFEQVAKACQWPKEEWAAQLWKALNGEAEWVPTSFVDRDDYGDMKAAILQGDAAQRQCHCQDFRHFCYREAEGPRGAYYRLRDLCQSWLRIRKGSKEQIVELLILEQFLIILPPEMQDFVRERNPDTCSCAVALAEDFLREQQEESLETIESLDSSGRPPPLRLPEEAPCSGDAKSLLASFEQVAKACHWPKEERVAQLSHILSGDTKRAFVPLDAGERENYRKMKALMLQGDALNRGRNHQKFRNFSYEEAGGPRRAQWRLRKLGKRWLEPARCTKEQIIDLVILEQLLAILPPEIQTWVREKDPETCSHAVSIAEEFLLKQGEEEEKEQAAAEESVPVSLDESPAFSDSEQGILKVIIKEEDDDEEAILFGDLQKAENKEGLSELSVERTEPPMEEESFGNKCPLCGKDFTCRSDLNRHRKTHTEEKPFQCFECAKSFAQGDYLILHQRLCHREKPYHCLECGKGFYHSTRLISHRRTHAAEKRYKCSACSKSFYHWARFLQHKRVKHSSERPHKCLECRKSFRRSAHLTRHQRVHANKTAYQCLECGKSFSYSEHLSLHQRRHMGEKLFKCLVCGKHFKFSRNLITHLQMHTGEKPFECL